MGYSLGTRRTGILLSGVESTLADIALELGFECTMDYLYAGRTDINVRLMRMMLTLD